LLHLWYGVEGKALLLSHAAAAEVREGCQEIVALLQEALAEARTLTRELSPPTRHPGDLRAALEWLSGWMGEKHLLTVRVHPPAMPLPVLREDLGVLLYQSVRELLLNTVKYAQVPAADVTLAQGADAVQLTVTDAGVGFDPTRLRVMGGTEGGFGLLSIRERLELLGGRLDIVSCPGQGSQFTLWVPPPGRAHGTRPPVAPGSLSPTA
jgi:signal transduction histidine kinase